MIRNFKLIKHKINPINNKTNNIYKLNNLKKIFNQKIQIRR